MSDEGGAWTKGHEFSTQYAIEGLRALTLANGGAVVAIRTFCGNANNDRVDVHAVAAALSPFAAGLAAALVVCFFAYLGQGAYTHDKKYGLVFEIIATVAAVASIGLFVWGCVTALHGFRATGPKQVTASTMSCQQAVEFIRAQSEGGRSEAHNAKNGSDAVLVRGGWVILPVCR